MSLLKNIKLGGLKSKHTEVVLFLVIVCLGIYLVYNYSSKFSKTVTGVQESLSEFKPELVPADVTSSGPKKPDILPSGNDSLLPAGPTPTQDYSFMIGTSSTRDTRNANLQLRADPVIKTSDVGPWGNTTIMPSEVRQQGLV